ncbi:hypothetical protein WJX81_000497 [Elliptochloris bilobata]|uniref:PX domain-containing protein n=1 Tax=Elliptochloris bilobata TaxID=381761 RepID=A0AAW1RK69_9CHLO
MASGWKFSVTVPSWTQTTLENDEVVVFYRVEVRVLPPEGRGPERTRSVLRRFSHFTKLHARLRKELGPKAMEGREPPPRRALAGVNRRPDLIERRRRELEQWLWRLVADPELARSRPLNGFLELSDAARLVQRAASSAASVRSDAVGYPMSEGSSPRGDAASTVSGFTAASADALEAPAAGATAGLGTLALSLGTGPAHRRVPSGAQSSSSEFGEIEADGPPGGAAGSNNGAVTAGLNPNHQRSTSETGARAAAGGAAGAADGGGSRLRLGLRVEQRGSVRKHVTALQQRLDRAAADMQDAAEAVEAERGAKRRLAARVAELEEAAAASASGRAAQAHAKALARSAEQLSQAEAVAAAEAERASAAEAVSGEAAAEASALRGELEAAREEASATAATSAADLAAAQRGAEAAAAERVAADAKAKDSMKLLAKEVKNLRRDLAAERVGSGDLSFAAGRRALDVRGLLAEVTALRERLADATADALATGGRAEALGSEGLGSSVRGGPADAELLAVSDGRLQMLLAEARLLAAPPAADGARRG